MATFAEYWAGTVRAEISQRTFSSDMLNELYRGAPVTAFCNQAFKLFYDARQAIDLCRDPTQKGRMTEALEDAATDGSGSGVSDLAEAFQHLVDYQDRWYDDNVDTYSGGPGKFFASSVRAPLAIVNFADAIDEAMGDLKDVVEQFTRVQTTVADTIRQAGGGAQSNWSRIGDAAAEVATWSERAGHLLWLVGELPEVRSAAGVTNTFASLVSSVHGGLTTAAQLGSVRGVDQRMANAMGALRVVAGQLPILGQIYVRAIDAIPELVAVVQHAVDTSTRRLEAVDRAGPWVPRGITPRAPRPDERRGSRH